MPTTAPTMPTAPTTATTMRAVLGHSLADLGAYQLLTLPIPVPGPQEVRVRVAAASLGYADGLIATGRYQVKPPLPFVPACEFAGVIDALGDELADVGTWHIGQRVAAQALGGGLAEYALAHVGALNATPAALDDAASAAFWVDHATALHALRDRARLQRGETVLVLGAAGGVGLAGVQVARLLGGRVFAAASSAAKRAAAQQAGAQEVIDYTAASWTDEIKRLTLGKGVDVIFDPVGGTTFEPAFRRLAWGGRHVVLGFTGGAIPALPTNLALLKGASLVGADIRQFTNIHGPDEARAQRTELAAWVSEGHLRPFIGARFSLAQFAQALAACSDRQRIGKTVVMLDEQASPATPATPQSPSRSP